MIIINSPVDAETCNRYDFSINGKPIEGVEERTHLRIKRDSVSKIRSFIHCRGHNCVCPRLCILLNVGWFTCPYHENGDNPKGPMFLWSAYVLSHLTNDSNILISSKRVIHKIVY